MFYYYDYSVATISTAVAYQQGPRDRRDQQDQQGLEDMSAFPRQEFI